MDNGKSIHISEVQIAFTDSFPVVGEKREIIKSDGSEWLIEVIEILNFKWRIENGKVTGVLADMRYIMLEETRPSSKGKLRLI